MKTNLTYCVNKNLIPEFYYEVLTAYGLSAKNIKNSSLFLIRNIFNSYEFNKELKSYQLKSNLHDNQQEVINLTNQAINVLNQKLKVKFESNQALPNEERKLNKVGKEKTLVQFTEYNSLIDSKTYYQIINKSVLETVIKIKENKNTEFKDYTIIHSHLAQSVLQQVCDEYSYYFKALKEYFKVKGNKNNNSFTGKPKEPGYKSKNSQISFELPIQRFNQNGSTLIIGKNHKIYKDYAKTDLIKAETIEQFNSFNLMEIIVNDLKKKNINYLNNIVKKDIVSIRIIPGKYKKKPKIEYVVSFEKELKGFYPALLNKANTQYSKDFFELKDKQKLALLKDYFNNDYVENLNNINPCNLNLTNQLTNKIQVNIIPYFMGIDLGVVNFAGVSFFTQNKDINYVISGKNLKTNINKLDIKLDKRKKELCIETIKSIQSKKDKKEQLTRQELRLLTEYYKSLNGDIKLSEYQSRKNDITQDFIHKLSKCLIQDCVAKGIKLIVVGKNKGWKQEINIGAKNNRTMYNFPHAKFIELLKYKALLNDIVVIETEESYTSKTSFIDNEELKVFKEKEKKLEENKKVEIIGDESSKVKNKENSNDKIDGKGKLKNSKNLTQGTKNQLSGKRVNQIFISNYKSKRVKIHADINGSFNIVRKVLNGLKYDKKLMTIDYQLMELALGGKKKLFNFYDQKTLNKVNVKKNKSSVKNLNQTVVEVANNLNLVVLSTTL